MYIILFLAVNILIVKEVGRIIKKESNFIIQRLKQIFGNHLYHFQVIKVYIFCLKFLKTLS